MWLVLAQVLRVLLQFLGVHVNISSVASGRHCVLAITHYLSLNLLASLSWQVPEPWGLGFEEDVPLRAVCSAVSLCTLPSCGSVSIAIHFQKTRTDLSVSESALWGWAGCLGRRFSVNFPLPEPFLLLYFLRDKVFLRSLGWPWTQASCNLLGAGITSVCQQAFLAIDVWKPLLPSLRCFSSSVTDPYSVRFDFFQPAHPGWSRVLTQCVPAVIHVPGAVWSSVWCLTA